MKSCLVDANVWLALVARQHQHHTSALAWFDRLGPAEAAVCRIVQLTVIRLLANRTIMAESALSLLAAWDLLQTLLADERVDFVPEPAGIDSILPTLFRYSVPAGKLVADSYLAAFALSAGRRLTTFDSGFRQFRGLEVELLR